MKIQRRFEPDHEALESVVETLYGLLVEPSEGLADRRGRETFEPLKSGCVSEEAEG
jgi:hypothetical protein